MFVVSYLENGVFKSVLFHAESTAAALKVARSLGAKTVWKV